ncbi:MAG TPA: TIGR03546 family protein [Bacteroidota bacterium]|nr:TIGR03546 family protein [Bacteroidota bacterium]
MFWFKFIRDFINILRAGQTPQQIAGGFALGSILGLSPMLTLQGAFVWLILLALDVNFSAAGVAMTICSLVAYLFDPLFHWMGYQILVNIGPLHGLWTWMYNAPIAPLTRFNNTVVMGSFICAIILFIPVYSGMKSFVVAYRTHIHSRLEKWKIYRALDRSKLLDWYRKIRDLKG